MIKEFDELAITNENYDKLTATERKQRTQKRYELIKKMNEKEIEELLKRPYPSQFKMKIKELRN